MKIGIFRLWIRPNGEGRKDAFTLYLVKSLGELSRELSSRTIHVVLSPRFSKLLTKECAFQNNGQLGVLNPKEVFYGDVPEAVAELAMSEIRNQSQNSLETPSGPPAWSDTVYNNRRAYSHTLLDEGIPTIAQEIMLQQSGVQ